MAVLDQPIDWEFFEWNNIFPASEETPLLHIARFFAGFGLPIWGGWMGYLEITEEEREAFEEEFGGQFDKVLHPTPNYVDISAYYRGVTDATKWSPMTGRYNTVSQVASVPWFNYEVAYLIEASADIQNTLNPCHPDGKTDDWKLYDGRKVDGNKYNSASYVNVHRRMVEECLDGLTDDEFSVLIYLFLKTEISRALRSHIDKIPRGDRDLPQPEILGILYYYLHMLTDVHSDETLYYLYTRIPQIFYTYHQPSFKVMVREPKYNEVYPTQDCDSTKTGVDQAGVPWQPSRRVLYYPFGITEHTNYEGQSPVDIPEYGGEDDAGNLDYSGAGRRAGNKGALGYESGADFWANIFLRKLPESFVTFDSIAYWLKAELLTELTEHIEQYRYAYENHTYTMPSPNNAINNANPITQGVDFKYRPLNTEAILSWWQQVAEAGLLQASDKELDDLAAKEETEDIENLDFSDCGPVPSLPPSATGCASCIPNPKAVIPDWTTLTESEPFLNEKTCEYSITTLSTEENIYSVPLGEILVRAIRPGLEKLLTNYDKDASEKTLDQLVPLAVAKDYFVPVRPGLKIRVLVTLSSALMDKVGPPPGPTAEEKEAESSDGSSGDSEATSETVLKGFEIRRYFKVAIQGMRKIGHEHIFSFLRKDKEGKNAGRYLLNCPFYKDGLQKYRAELIKFLRKNTFKINPTSGKTAALDEVKLKFDSEYNLVEVWANKMGCPTEQLIEGFDTFKNKSPVNNETISALVAQLPELVKDLSKSDPIRYGEFADKYVYPPLEAHDRDELDEQPLTEGDDCNVGHVLQNVFKGPLALGSQAIGEGLTFFELWADEFNEQICTSYDGVIEGDKKMENPKDQKKRIQDQWHRQIETADEIFTGIPDIIAETANIFEMFEKLINKLGFCGFLAVLEKVSDCVVGGFDIDKSAKTLLAATINNFTQKQVEGIFFAMNPGLQKLITDAVKELTELPFPWEAGYRPGSYNDPDINEFGENMRDVERRLAQFYKEEANIELIFEEKYKDVLQWPEGYEEGEWFAVGGDTNTEYSWIDENNLQYRTRTLAGEDVWTDVGTMGWQNAPQDVHLGRPMMVAQAQWVDTDLLDPDTPDADVLEGDEEGE